MYACTHMYVCLCMVHVSINVFIYVINQYLRSSNVCMLNAFSY